MLRVALALLLALWPAWLTAESLVLGLSKDNVAIDVTFNGSDILIFGAVKGSDPNAAQAPLQVVVAVAGPSSPVLVRRKDRRFGIWVNTDAVEVDEAPSFYAVATSAPWDNVLTDTEDLRYKISIPRAIRSVGAPMDIMDSQSFSEALIRIRTGSGLYQVREGAVDFQEQTLFKTSITMPANLTEGDYVTRILLTREGEVVGQHETIIDVRKVGLERWLYALSRNQPLAYGLLSLAIAIFAGWGASAVFTAFRRT